MVNLKYNINIIWFSYTIGRIGYVTLYFDYNMHLEFFLNVYIYPHFYLNTFNLKKL